MQHASAQHSSSDVLSLHLQLFFKRSTLYIPFVLVGAYFANEVRSSKLQDRPAACSRPSLTQV
jgi:hypothetical protein